MNVIESFTAADGIAAKGPVESTGFVVNLCDPEWDYAFRRDPVSGMTHVWTAWKIGFVAAANGIKKDANPFLRAGENCDRPGYPISGGWETGWLHGQGRQPEDVEREFAKWLRTR